MLNKCKWKQKQICDSDKCKTISSRVHMAAKKIFNDLLL